MRLAMAVAQMASETFGRASAGSWGMKTAIFVSPHAAAIPTTPDGSRTYLMIPTTTVMDLKDAGRMRVRSVERSAMLLLSRSMTGWNSARGRSVPAAVSKF